MSCISYFRTPEPAKDLQNSEVLKMIQASENQGKRVISPEPETKVDTGFIKGQNYGMSFKVLQWMTETDQDNDVSEDVDEQCMITIYCPSFDLLCKLSALYLYIYP